MSSSSPQSLLRRLYALWLVVIGGAWLLLGNTVNTVDAQPLQPEYTHRFIDDIVPVPSDAFADERSPGSKEWSVLLASYLDDFPPSPINLPWAFHWFNETHNAAHVSADGAVVFGGFDNAPQCCSSLANLICSAAADPYSCIADLTFRNMIMAYLTDLFPGLLADANIFVRSKAGENAVTVRYQGVPVYDPLPDTYRLTFDVTLHRSGAVTVRYHNVTDVANLGYARSPQRPPREFRVGLRPQASGTSTSETRDKALLRQWNSTVDFNILVERAAVRTGRTLEWFPVGREWCLFPDRGLGGSIVSVTPTTVIVALHIMSVALYNWYVYTRSLSCVFTDTASSSRVTVPMTAHFGPGSTSTTASFTDRLECVVPVSPPGTVHTVTLEADGVALPTTAKTFTHLATDAGSSLLMSSLCETDACGAYLPLLCRHDCADVWQGGAEVVCGACSHDGNGDAVANGIVDCAGLCVTDADKTSSAFTLQAAAVTDISVPACQCKDADDVVTDCQAYANKFVTVKAQPTTTPATTPPPWQYVYAITDGVTTAPSSSSTWTASSVRGSGVTDDGDVDAMLERVRPHFFNVSLLDSVFDHVVLNFDGVVHLRNNDTLSLSDGRGGFTTVAADRYDSNTNPHDFSCTRDGSSALLTPPTLTSLSCVSAYSVIAGSLTDYGPWFAATVEYSDTRTQFCVRYSNMVTVPQVTAGTAPPHGADTFTVCVRPSGRIRLHYSNIGDPVADQSSLRWTVGVHSSLAPTTSWSAFGQQSSSSSSWTLSENTRFVSPPRARVTSGTQIDFCRVGNDFCLTRDTLSWSGGDVITVALRHDDADADCVVALDVHCVFGTSVYVRAAYNVTQAGGVLQCVAPAFAAAETVTMPFALASGSSPTTATPIPAASLHFVTYVAPTSDKLAALADDTSTPSYVCDVCASHLPQHCRRGDDDGACGGSGWSFITDRYSVDPCDNVCKLTTMHTRRDCHGVCDGPFVEFLGQCLCRNNIDCYTRIDNYTHPVRDVNRTRQLLWSTVVGTVVDTNVGTWTPLFNSSTAAAAAAAAAISSETATLFATTVRTLALPFAFPYLHGNYSRVTVSVDGVLLLARSVLEGAGAAGVFLHSADDDIDDARVAINDADGDGVDDDITRNCVLDGHASFFYNYPFCNVSVVGMLADYDLAATDTTSTVSFAMTTDSLCVRYVDMVLQQRRVTVEPVRSTFKHSFTVCIYDTGRVLLQTQNAVDGVAYDTTSRDWAIGFRSSVPQTAPAAFDQTTQTSSSYLSHLTATARQHWNAILPSTLTTASAATVSACPFDTDFCVSPVVGPASGGNIIRVMWAMTTSCVSALNIQCQFDGVIASAAVIASDGSSSLLCTVPAGSVNSAVEVQLVSNGRVIHTQHRHFYSYVDDASSTVSAAAMSVLESVPAICDRCAVYDQRFCWLDCAGEWQGSSFVDSCGTCTKTSTVDCEGLCGGNFVEVTTATVTRCQCTESIANCTAFDDGNAVNPLAVQYVYRPVESSPPRASSMLARLQAMLAPESNTVVYDVARVSPNEVNATSSTPVFTSSRHAFTTVFLSFSFDYFGEVYTQVAISSDGSIHLTEPPSAACRSAGALTRGLFYDDYTAVDDDDDDALSAGECARTMAIIAPAMTDGIDNRTAAAGGDADQSVTYVQDTSLLCVIFRTHFYNCIGSDGHILFHYRTTYRPVAAASPTVSQWVAGLRRPAPFTKKFPFALSEAGNAAWLPDTATSVSADNPAVTLQTGSRRQWLTVSTDMIVAGQSLEFCVLGGDYCLNPRRGPVSGGNVVTVMWRLDGSCRMTELLSQLRCVFGSGGGSAAVGVVHADMSFNTTTSAFECTVPPGLAPATLGFHVELSGVRVPAEHANFYTYLPDDDESVSDVNVAVALEADNICQECAVLNTEYCVADCMGTYRGTAFLDTCDVCSGGKSGHEADSDIDCAGICSGPFTVSSHPTFANVPQHCSCVGSQFERVTTSFNTGISRCKTFELNTVDCTIYQSFRQPLHYSRIVRSDAADDTRTALVGRSWSIQFTSSSSSSSSADFQATGISLTLPFTVRLFGVPLRSLYISRHGSIYGAWGVDDDVTSFPTRCDMRADYAHGQVVAPFDATTTPATSCNLVFIAAALSDYDVTHVDTRIEHSIVVVDDGDDADVSSVCIKFSNMKILSSSGVHDMVTCIYVDSDITTHYVTVDEAAMTQTSFNTVVGVFVVDETADAAFDSFSSRLMRSCSVPTCVLLPSVAEWTRYSNITAVASSLWSRVRGVYQSPSTLRSGSVVHYCRFGQNVCPYPSYGSSAGGFDIQVTMAEIGCRRTFDFYCQFGAIYSPAVFDSTKNMFACRVPPSQRDTTVPFAIVARAKSQLPRVVVNDDGYVFTLTDTTKVNVNAAYFIYLAVSNAVVAASIKQLAPQLDGFCREYRQYNPVFCRRDCFGVYGGTGRLDNCNTCVGPDAGDDDTKDCLGVCHGPFVTIERNGQPTCGCVQLSGSACSFYKRAPGDGSIGSEYVSTVEMRLSALVGAIGVFFVLAGCRWWMLRDYRSLQRRQQDEFTALDEFVAGDDGYGG